MKKRIICLIFMFPSWFMVLILSKKVYFLQFCGDLSKKYKFIKAIYIYVLKDLVTHFQKMVLLVMLWSTVSGYIRVWSRRILLNFCWVRTFYDILIANISWTVAQTPIDHTIFCKTVMRTFICIYGNCFNRLRFLAEVSIKLEKMHLHFFGHFTYHNSGRKHGSPLTVCNIHFYIWK